MKKWARFIPDGMRDYILEDVKRKRMIEQSLTKVFEKRGFWEICTPTMEFFDVFDTKEDNVPYEDLYKLFDAKGRILTLRHDMTTPISRVAATKLRGEQIPIKLYYNQNVYRSNDALDGKRDEITQCGVEILGLSNYKADVDVLVTAIEALKSAIDGDFTIELGHIQFFKAIAEQLNTDQETIENIRSSIERKNFAQVDSILEEMDQNNPGVTAMKRLPRLFGGVDVLEEARVLAPSQKALDILQELQHIIDELTILGYGQYIGVDLGMVHHIGYYTGLIFRGYLAGSGENCLAGGRYDHLSRNFGGNLPSTGFAITVDSILDTQQRTETVADVNTAPHSVIFYDDGCVREAYQIYETIQMTGRSCVISLYEDFDEALAHAKALGAQMLYDVKKDKTEIINLV